MLLPIVRLFPSESTSEENVIPFEPAEKVVSSVRVTSPVKVMPAVPVADTVPPTVEFPPTIIEETDVEFLEVKSPSTFTSPALKVPET